MKTTKIPYVPLALSHQKPVLETNKSYIEFSDKTLRINLSFVAKEPEEDDEECEWEEVNNQSDLTISRINLTAMEKVYVKESRVWKIALYVMSINREIRLYFKTNAQATELLDVIRK